jgi:RimJ/RimL family protein N-acetyltransferase
LEPELRPLRQTDIPDIIDISRTTWGGHDHLPMIINGWLKDKTSHPFVFVHDGRAIGVANVRIIDDGITAWLEGLRVHEKARKKGLGEKMTYHLAKVSKELGVRRIRLVTSADNIAPIKLAARIGMQQIAKYHVFWKGYRRSIKWKYQVIDVKRIHPEDVFDVIYENKRLVPQNALIKHWDFYEASQTRIRELSESSIFLAGQDDRGATLSIGGVESLGQETEWCFALYATTPEAFLSGLSANLATAQEQGHHSLFCIHPAEYVSLYPAIKWLRNRSHEIGLILHELAL